jgi:hypothetical protein
MSDTINGEVRRFSSGLSTAGDRPLRLTFTESVAVAQVEPANVEASRAGKRFLLGNSAAITGIANVTSLPTTAAQWVLYNTSERKTLFFEEIGMYLTSGTPGVGGILLAALIKLPLVAAPGTPHTGTKVSSASSLASGSLVAKSAITVTEPAAPTWYHIASNPSPNVTAFAASTYLEHRNLQGAIAVQPGYGLGLCVVAPAGTSPLFAPFARWIELDSDME